MANEGIYVELLLQQEVALENFNQSAKQLIDFFLCKR